MPFVRTRQSIQPVLLSQPDSSRELMAGYADWNNCSQRRMLLRRQIRLFRTVVTAVSVVSIGLNRVIDRIAVVRPKIRVVLNGAILTASGLCEAKSSEASIGRMKSRSSWSDGSPRSTMADHQANDAVRVDGPR